MGKDESKIDVLTEEVHSPVIRRSPENISTPVLSKQSLHDYFADKMAAFSIVVGYIFESYRHCFHIKGPRWNL